MFIVPIGNSKNLDETRFNTDASMLKYCQNTSNSCCVSSLASAFDSINKIKFINATSKRIEESLTSRVSFSSCIDFNNSILKNQKIVKCEQKLYYKMKKYKHMGYFNILNDIS